MGNRWQWLRRSAPVIGGIIYYGSVDRCDGVPPCQHTGPRLPEPFGRNNPSFDVYIGENRQSLSDYGRKARSIANPEQVNSHDC
jgi:hypothetical protein